MHLPRLLLFDIDGVLIDVRPSYHRVIRLTVPTYLRQVLGLNAPDDLITEAHVAAIKRMGGFNNDWNSVAAMLYTLVAQLPPVPEPPERTPAALRAVVRSLSQDPRVPQLLRAGADALLRMEETVRAAGGGLNAVRAQVGTRNAHLVLYGPWNPETNLVMRIYQELYLGPELFSQEYGLPRAYAQGPGLIDDEVRIISRDTLDTLAARHTMGLVTGRPRVEAEYALKRLGLWDVFQVLVSHDEVVAEIARRGSDEFLGKPHPWPLKAAADALDPGGDAPIAFVGDTGDDMRAAVAVRAWRPALAIGCTYVHDDKEAAAAHLRAEGADIIIEHPDLLREEPS